MAFSQGMRASRSSRLEAQDHIFIFTIGCFEGICRVAEEVAGLVDSNGSMRSFAKVEPVIFVVGVIREGNEDAVARVMMKKRIAVNATYPY